VKGQIIAIGLTFGVLAAMSTAQATRPATADEIGHMQLGLMAFEPPAADAQFLNHSGVTVEQGTIEIQIISDERVTAARQFSVTTFEDHFLGRRGSALPHTWSHFSLAQTFTRQESAGTNGYWFRIVSATVHDPSPAASASFEDLCADLCNGQTGDVNSRLQRDPSIALRGGGKETTLMHVAAHLDCVPIMQVLKAAGASYASTALFGVQPIHSAAANNSYKAFRFLTDDAKANPNAKAENGWRPLHYAVFTNSMDTIKMMMRVVDIDAVDDQHATALDQCSLSNKEDIAKLLLKFGANPNIPDKNGEFPIDHFATRGSGEIIETLVHAGNPVDLSCTDIEYTPLHFAAKFGNADAVQQLLSLGADPNIKTQHGNTPGDLARKYGHEQLADFLKSKERR
jgi:ankyrin repeat protein